MKKILAALMILISFSVTEAQLTAAIDYTVVSTDNDTFNLFNLLSSGNFVFMEFGARWCGPCRASMPTLVSMWNKYHSENGCFFLISFDVEQNETTDMVKQFEVDYVMPFPACAMDSNNNGLLNLCNQYTASYSIPHFILVKPDRSIPYMKTGGIPIVDTTGLFAIIDSIMINSGNCSVGFTDINNTQKTINVFPNPFSNQLTFGIADKEWTTVTIYDFLGRKILQQTVTNSTTINTEQLVNGIYFYELRSSKGTLKTGTLVKHGEVENEPHTSD